MGASFTSNLGLDIAPISTDKNNLRDLWALYNAVKILATNLDSYTGIVEEEVAYWPSTPPQGSLLLQNHSRIYVPFSETVTPGNTITLWNDSGVLRAKKGSAGDVRGFAPHAVSSGSYGVVCLLGLCQVISGMTPGIVYYAQPTIPGLVTATVPVVGGQIVQPLGHSLSASLFYFNPALVGTVVAATP